MPCSLFQQAHSEGQLYPAGGPGDSVWGPASGLLWDRVNFVDLLRAAMQPEQCIHRVVENVQGVSRRTPDAKAMSIALRCEPPILVDAEECSWAIRPRLRRFSWRLLPKRGEQLTQVGAWQKLGGWASKEASPRPPSLDP